MRYHWRMKYLESTKVVIGAGMNHKLWGEARELRERLLARLDHYGKRPIEDVFLDDHEACDPKLLTRSDAA